VSADEPTPRERFARHQRRWRARWAINEADSGGRLHAEAEDPYRTCFQRDRDRILHCSAFRRLDYKTQVFIPHVQDHLRTRLTHTLEVAQIGRDLARTLRVNEDLVEAVALAHDLGHPPFGHTGEAALDELMAENGHFEHNRQSLRVVSYLEHPYPGFRGLNLTRTVCECLAKHTTRYDTPDIAGVDTAGEAPIEGQLVDACDEIAYTSADVEDALQAGWITAAKLAELDLWRAAWRRAERLAPGAREIHKQIRATKALLAILAEDVVTATLATLERLKIDNVAAVRAAAEKCVTFSDAVAGPLRQVQDFLYREVYTNDAARPEASDARRRLAELFGHFIAHPDALPARYESRIGDDGLHRTVCDYIAGMTDRFCTTEHTRLCP